MSGCDSFDFEAPQDDFPFWEGLRGADGVTYFPHISADGILSWTNNGGLPNPQPVDISGPPGSSVELRGPVESVADLPVSASSSELWLVGTASPYDGWFYNGVRWENAGQIAVGPPGPVGEDGVSPVIEVTDIPGGHRVTITDATGTKSIDIMDGTDGEQGAPGATPDLQIGTVATGEPGSDAEATITGTPTAPRLNLTLPRGQQGPAVPMSDATPLMDGTASAGTGTSAARADHRHPTDTTRAAAADLATYVRPNLLDNWYFVGGGSQLGYGTFPINQRGQTIYQTAGAFAIDRWKLNSGGRNCSVALNSDGVTLATGNAQGDWCLIQELNVSPLLGKTVTVSIKVESVSGRGYCHLYTNPNSTPSFDITSAGVFSRTMTIPAGTTRIRLVIGAPTSMVVSACKVEIGSTQTLAHQEDGVWVLNEIPDYSEELYKCYTSHADPSDPYANKSVQYVEDTGWFDLTNYLDTTYVAVRPGYTPKVRIINGVMYYSGEVYIHTQPPSGTSRILVFNNIPSAYRPSGQISAAGFTYSTLVGYFIYATGLGDLQVSAESYAVQEQYRGFSLSMLSGNLK